VKDGNLRDLWAHLVVALVLGEQTLSDAVHGHGRRFASLSEFEGAVSDFLAVFDLVCRDEGGDWIALCPCREGDPPETS
jgi:hypothetical protein